MILFEVPIELQAVIGTVFDRDILNQRVVAVIHGDRLRPEIIAVFPPNLSLSMSLELDAERGKDTISH